MEVLIILDGNLETGAHAWRITGLFEKKGLIAEHSFPSQLEWFCPPPQKKRLRKCVWKFEIWNKRNIYLEKESFLILLFENLGYQNTPLHTINSNIFDIRIRLLFMLALRINSQISLNVHVFYYFINASSILEGICTALELESWSLPWDL